jgi:light-independent protochlorophyllide reductase subunit B
MGLEEHLIMMFREDFEFSHEAPASHLGHAAVNGAVTKPQPAEMPAYFETTELVVSWAPEALKELGKIPFFVRGKARKNTERYAQEQGMKQITVETLYDAKAHFSR